MSIGCHPAFGIHHNNQLNALNLADDLIEPFRPIVDLNAYAHFGSGERLSKSERMALAHTLHNAYIVNGVKVNILHAIELMTESFKRLILHKTSEPLALPEILPVESMEGITE